MATYKNIYDRMLDPSAVGLVQQHRQVVNSTNTFSSVARRRVGFPAGTSHNWVSAWLALPLLHEGASQLTACCFMKYVIFNLVSNESRFLRTST